MIRMAAPYRQSPCAEALRKSSIKLATYFAVLFVIAYFAGRYHIGEFQEDQERYEIHETDVPENIVKETPAFNTHAKCTFDQVKRYMARFRQLPNKGTWVKSGTSGDEYYKPDFCARTNPKMTPNFMKSCLAQSDIKYIVTMGDSNAATSYERILGYINGATDGRCKLVKKEESRNQFDPDPKYFATGDPEVDSKLETHYRYCGTCWSRQSKCKISDRPSNDVTLEHIAMPLMMDTAIRVFVPYELRTEQAQDFWALTTQEYIFRYYFQQRPPDVLVLFLPFSHMKHGNNMARTEVDLQFFKSLTNVYLPNTTRIVYVPMFAEYESLKPKPYKNMLFEGMLGTEKIDRLNKLFYEVFEEELLMEHGRTFSFVDSVAMSVDRVDLGLDGVHMKDEWHEYYTSLFLELFCNSILQGEFGSSAERHLSGNQAI